MTAGSLVTGGKTSALGSGEGPQTPPWRAGTDVKARGRLCGPGATSCGVWSTECTSVHTYANTVHSSICRSQLRGLARQLTRRVTACEFRFGQSERVTLGYPL